MEFKNTISLFRLQSFLVTVKAKILWNVEKRFKPYVASKDILLYFTFLLEWQTFCSPRRDSRSTRWNGVTCIT